MQSEAPLLTREELSRKLGELLEARPEAEQGRVRRKLMAIHGRCDKQVLDVAGRQVEVIPVASELELREVLPDPHEERDIALVLGYAAVEVPIDLAGRFRKRGRVVRIAKLERLRQLFTGVDRSLVEFDAALVDSALARHLLGLEVRTPLRTRSGMLGLEQGYALWLHSQWGLPEQLALDNLLVFAATSQRFEQFKETMRKADAHGLLDELLGVLTRALGSQAALIWQKWLDGKGTRLLEFALACEAHLTEPHERLSELLRAAARYELHMPQAEFESAMPVLAHVSATALTLYRAQCGEGPTRSLLLRAETFFEESDRKYLRGSRRLPCAWAARLDALGEAMLAHADAPSLAGYEALGEALNKLELHDAIALVENRALVERAVMARRLAAWLVVRSQEKWLGSRSGQARFEALVHWYAHEGGFVDLARWRARVAASGESRFAAGVAALLQRVDELRVEQDREFARGLSGWLASSSERVLPIHRALDRFGAAFLRAQGGARRRVLVLLLDGMAWSQAVELLMMLGSDNTAVPWHPLAWNRTIGQVDPKGSHVPVLAALPTDTSVSRSAFFAGEPAKAGVEPRSDDDRTRWSKHPSIAPLFVGARQPLLLIGADAFDAKGVRTPTRTAIADVEQPVVAIVVNVIDDALKSNVDDAAEWTPERIAPLRELFECARLAGRAVMLCSDHGNVSGRRLEYAGFGAGGKARWRPLVQGETPREFEVAIESPPGWRPNDPRAKGVMLICDDAHTYSGKRSYGEHGGASLAEVVTPTLLLGTEELASAELGDDPALGLLPLRPPSWWLDDVREPEGERAAREEEYRKLAKSSAARASEPAPQLALPVLSETPEQQDLQAEARRRVADAEAKLSAQGKKTHQSSSSTTNELLLRLQANPLFEARTAQSEPGQANMREEVLAALEFLLERRDQVSDESFAARLGKQKGRVGGLVSTISEVLNVDGYAVLSYDTHAKQVRLDRELLVQGFGL